MMVVLAQSGERAWESTWSVVWDKMDYSLHREAQRVSFDCSLVHTADMV